MARRFIRHWKPRCAIAQLAALIDDEDETIVFQSAQSFAQGVEADAKGRAHAARRAARVVTMAGT
jgi:hypothetical protein